MGNHRGQPSAPVQTKKSSKVSSKGEAFVEMYKNICAQRQAEFSELQKLMLDQKVLRAQRYTQFEMLAKKIIANFDQFIENSKLSKPNSKSETTNS